MPLFEKLTRSRDCKEAGRLQSMDMYPFFRAIESSAGPMVSTAGKKLVMIGSNNYLGLTEHPRVKEAAVKAIEKYGTGCTGSRLLNGNLDLHEELEEALCKYLKREATLVYASGFLANLGAISSLAGRKDIIFSDKENHASIVEGQSSSLAKTVRYRHNDMNELERLLKEYSHVPGKLIISDGIFSMTGRIANMPKIVALASQYGARVYCDSAHDLGVLGPEGRGISQHFNLNEKVDVVMATFSKSFASSGGFVSASKEVIHFLKHNSRSFIFSAALPPASTAAVLECIKLVQEDDSILKNLWKNVNKMRTAFRELNYDTMGSSTPIIPVLIGDDQKAFLFTKRLYELGIFATPVVPPAVPPDMALIRTSYIATHTDTELDHVIEVFEKLGKELDITTGAAKKKTPIK